jgi:cyclophilin family peptidyl-prolyl cis-trans isomerase
MPSADKRARKKENARAAREQREAALRRKKRTRSGVTVAVVVAIFVGVIVLLNVVGGGGKKKATTTSTTAKTTTTTTIPVVLPKGCVRTVPPAAKAQTFKAAPPMTIDATKTYTATFTTSCGSFTAVLDAKNDPKGVNNFVFLANKHFFDGLTWHRVVTNFVIQSGDPTGSGSGGPGYSLVTETPKSGYPLGTLARAKAPSEASGTAGSQFFVVTGTATQALSQKANGSYQYGVFGTVTQGLANAQKIMSLSTGDGPPKAPMYIDKVTITES